MSMQGLTKSLAIPTVGQTSRYLEYLEDAYLLFAAPNVVHRLENAVFLALRRRGESVTYAGEKNSWECDFVTASQVIQVYVELTPQNRDREIQGVLRAMTLPGKRRPLILTLDQTDRMTVDDNVIDVQP